MSARSSPRSVDMAASASKAVGVWPATLPPMPEVDFAAFGDVECVELSRYQQIGGSFLARNWVHIPHVTHHDEVRVDALGGERKRRAAEAGRSLSPLPFLMRALAQVLAEFPRFNASLTPCGKRLIMKRYFHIGFAVEVENGLVVPVVRDCDQRSVEEIADEIDDKAGRARRGGLPMSDMSGGCMTVSSLGHIGGTGFTPIINAPELAVLGVSRLQTRVELDDAGQACKVSVLPMSLSYDHRVINGSDAARFCRALADLLEHPERL